MWRSFSSSEFTFRMDIRLEDKHLMHITSSLSVLLYLTRNWPSFLWICNFFISLSDDAKTSSSSSLLSFIVPNSQISFNECARHSWCHWVQNELPLVSKQPDIRIRYKCSSPPNSIKLDPQEGAAVCGAATSFSSSLSEISESLLSLE